MNTVIDTTWETLCSMARELLNEQDRQRWALGEIADTVETHYDEGSIVKFCEAVKARPKTLYQYRQVFRFYPKDVWQGYPLVRYTQWRDAMRLKDATKALALIEWANDDNVRMVDFYAKLDALAGKFYGVENLIHGEMTVDAAIEALTHFESSRRVKVIVKDVSP